ncbi:hypothetical protein CPSG_09866 [Coccidioides posadasii str. Silveira]|uniref:Uncharacterized protein n=1 Tax=Coccidioides posadasii (strain RMSCC 757 / Silveira) TaxID=443226 RepID=E9DJ67_COCPS|nr:hypothetical protein CPSG_09866 [Coccidioides posadasii str. Silveira]
MEVKRHKWTVARLLGLHRITGKIFKSPPTRFQLFGTRAKYSGIFSQNWRAKECYVHRRVETSSASCFLQEGQYLHSALSQHLQRPILGWIME